MENIDELEVWLERCLSDAKKKLGVTDKTLAYILLREATKYYFKTLEVK